jgi:hypothetical protein
VNALEELVNRKIPNGQGEDGYTLHTIHLQTLVAGIARIEAATEVKVSFHRDLDLDDFLFYFFFFTTSPYPILSPYQI